MGQICEMVAQGEEEKEKKKASILFVDFIAWDEQLGAFTDQMIS